MISASKSTLSLNNLKILRPKVTKNLNNLLKKFCEFTPRDTLVLNVLLELIISGNDQVVGYFKSGQK